eukprot:5796554-Alexandrium_andersonii.AAC.1
MPHAVHAIVDGQTQEGQVRAQGPTGDLPWAGAPEGPRAEAGLLDGGSGGPGRLPVGTGQNDPHSPDRRSLR